MAIAAGRGDLQAKLLHEAAAVESAGQLIGCRKPLQLGNPAAMGGNDLFGFVQQLQGPVQNRGPRRVGGVVQRRRQVHQRRRDRLKVQSGASDELGNLGI